MKVKQWQVDVTQAVTRASAGEVPVASVICSGVTAAEVEAFLDEVGEGRDGGTWLPVNSPAETAPAEQDLQPVKITLRPVKGEDYDFMCQDGVEVIVSRHAVLARLYERVEEVPAGLLRTAMMDFLRGRTAVEAVPMLESVIVQGLEYGEDSPYATPAEEEPALHLGPLPPAKA